MTLQVVFSETFSKEMNALLDPNYRPQVRLLPGFGHRQSSLSHLASRIRKRFLWSFWCAIVID